jgi:hypothetical protein
MPGKSPEMPSWHQSGDDEHGPKHGRRIPRSEYSEHFLRGLQATKQVRSVSEDWDRDPAKLPPRITWVMYPNGDLERVGFD